MLHADLAERPRFTPSFFIVLRGRKNEFESGALSCALLSIAARLPAHTVASSMIGTVLDPVSAVMSKAPVTLLDADTGSVRSASTDNSGVFRFLNLSPGVYSISIQVKGFKTLSKTSIVIAANETRDVGNIVLQIGNVTDTISVTAEATPVQLSSSEMSTEIDGNQLNAVTLKGRDLFGYLKLVPGVIDTTGNRDVTSPNAVAGITINGNTAGKINFTVDGITDMDTGSNNTLRTESGRRSGDEDSLVELPGGVRPELGRHHYGGYQERLA